MAGRLVTAPTAEPVTLAEAKLHVKQDSDADDALITALITAARDKVEYMTGRALMKQTWAEVLDRFPAERMVELPRWPLLSVTHVKYFDEAGDPFTVDADEYFVDTTSGPGRVGLEVGYTWPSASLRANGGVEIEYVAGEDNGDEAAQIAAVPEGLKLLIKFLVSHWYDRRGIVAEAQQYEVPQTLKDLAWQYRALQVA